jgi:hypothetical protein
MLIEDFYKDIINQNTIIHSSRFVNELKVFIWTESGKAEHAKNNNDDLIISYSFYTHLLDEVFSSRPIGIQNSKKMVTPETANAFEEDWQEKEDFYKQMYGMTLNDYYWMQVWSIPEDYKNWKQSQRMDGKREAEHSKKEDVDARKELGLEAPPNWVR